MEWTKGIDVAAKIKTAIFPIAGLGTRFLPATKSIPKEILTLVDKPLIQYAVEEARDAGITDFIFVTSKGKSSLEDFFDVNTHLETTLHKDGKTELLKVLQDTNLASGHIAYVRQHQALGLGHAVWCARRLVGSQPVAVILPDDLIVAESGCMKQMVQAYEKTGGTMVATMEVTLEQTSSYGIIDAEHSTSRLVQPRGIVEKPARGTAPSNLAVIGRYILGKGIMKHLDNQTVGAGGEIQLTDAIATELRLNPGSVYGFRFEGDRFDCGTKAGFLQATVHLALRRADLKDEFSQYLHAACGVAATGYANVSNIRSAAAR